MTYFPNKHNIQFTDSHSQEHDTSSSLAKNDTDGTISIPGSIDTGILKALLRSKVGMTLSYIEVQYKIKDFF
ncbi:CPA_1a_G0010230.mRNA.1.CDS.1 [Saccharomyces cerevisiae]|nr:CPA_1a_G0010230.mRNA.1.CDS.1 [Saccharomyces cerevisiae]CAI7203864.1 CPA_1a_G0010230.mRNA.1.CDS.1 [Saccharomyces cerevisiae]